MTDKEMWLKEYLGLVNAQVDTVTTARERALRNQVIKSGLRNADGTGVLAGVTGIGSVQGYMTSEGERVPMPGQLYFRGINATDIVEAHRQNGTYGYEEVAFLLLMGKLPTKEQYDNFRALLSEARQLPSGYNEDVLFKAPAENIMNQLARGVLGLYAYDPNPDDTSAENMLRQSIEIVAKMPAIVANSYAVMKHYIRGKSLHIHNPKPELSAAENFLRMARKDKGYEQDEAKLLDLMLMLHAEHGGGNNSAFVCRAVSSTGTDTYSAVAAAIGSLKGPLHGGANAQVMKMFEGIKANVGDTGDDDEVRSYLGKLLDGEAGDRSGKIYGLGHAVYTMSDPRAVAIKKYARDVAEKKGRLGELELLEKVERIGIDLITERTGSDLPICANVDMYSGLIYDMLSIPVDLFTPLFAIARSAGWCAHRMEEVLTCNRIMRPAYRAYRLRVPYVPMEER